MGFARSSKQVIKRLKKNIRRLSNALLFDSGLKQLFYQMNRKRRQPQEDRCKLGMTDKRARQLSPGFVIVTKLFYVEERRTTVSDPSEFEDGCRHLIAVLRS